MIARGWIARAEVERELNIAAIDAGLGKSEIGKTVNSGITAGLKNPHEDLSDDSSKPPQYEQRKWPVLDAEALHGLTGKVVRTIEPHTESDPAALLLQFLTSFGNAIDRGPFCQVEGTRHYTNMNVLLVGESSKSRKGTSADRIRQVMVDVDQQWVEKRILKGLSSGEGIIWQIRDEVTKPGKDGEEIIVVDGVDDKRLLIDEREFFQALSAMKREGNTVSAMVRDAWDSRRLASLTKNSPAACNEPHVSIGHITADELRRMLDHVSMANGYANRFLFVCVRRSKFLPFGGALEQSEIDVLSKEIKAAFVRVYRTSRQITMNNDAKELWASVYIDLSTGQPGLLGAITGRAEAQTIRLAMLYAILDGTDQIEVAHLRAALALWRYCEMSAAYIFGDNVGDPFTDDLLRALRNSGEMSRTQIRDHFKRNKSAAQIDTALETLERYGKVRRIRRTKQGARGGPPMEIWTADLR